MGTLRILRFLGLSFLLVPLHASDPDALAIEATILARHVPYGTILSPMFSADLTRIAAYTRCGDSAIWTGHYLAAEAFRYATTNSPDALANVRLALNGISLLVDVTGQDLLIRCAIPTDSPYAAGIINEEKPNGIFQATLDNRAWYFVGNTSRDQYCGVFFGLGAAYDLVPDASIRAGIASLATRMLNRLLKYSWNIVMPDGSISTTFIIRPDQQLALLQVGRHVNAQQFASPYANTAFALAGTILLPLGIDASDGHDSYFKFNLDFINLYNLIRLEDDSSRKSGYERGFSLIRGVTANHLNPHFNMIDRALHGPDRARDAETRGDLRAWLKRPRTDVSIDLRGVIPSCGNPDLACNPIPVAMRPPSDFLWQLDPFQLFAFGYGTIETAGIDYILPYWMARYYGVIADPLPVPRVHDRVLLHGVGRI